MSLLLHVYLAFDDDSPPELPVFSHDPCLWSLEEDWALASSGDRRFYAALGYDEDNVFSKPLIALRGSPEFIAAASAVRAQLDDQDYIGWLSAAELFAALRHASIREDELPRPVQILLGTVRHFVSFFDEERVRIIFAFIR